MPRWATCDACGESYSLPSGAPDVPADERLCPDCEATIASTRTAASEARKKTASRPESATARPTTPPKPAAANKPATAASAPAARPAAKPAPARPAAAAPPHVDHPIRSRAKEVDKPLDMATKIGGAIAGGLTVLAIIVVIVIRGQKSTEKELFEAQEKRYDEFIGEMRNYKLDVEGDTSKAIERAVAMESLWKNSRIAGDVTDILTRARTSQEVLKERRELIARLEAIEAKLADIDSMTSDQLEETKRSIDELEGRASAVGPEFMARLATGRAKIGRTFGSKLFDEAEAFAAANPTNGRAVLAKYTRAEDEALRSFERAIAEKNKEDEAYFRERYQECIKKSDEIAAATFTPEVIEKTPWKDLLRGEFAAQWNKAEVIGFDVKVEDGALRAVGPDPAAKKLGLVTIGDRANWRDYVLDMEFTIESGEFSTVYRLGRRTDLSENFVFNVGGEDGLQKGKKYTAEISLVGSVLRIAVTPDDIPVFENAEIKWTLTRKGAIGLVVNENTKFTISRLRIKDLR